MSFRELAGRELHHASRAGHSARDQVHLEIGNRQAQRFGGPPAPDERSNPGQQLGEGERLDQIIVGSAVEADHPILERIARRQDEHRRVDAALPQRAENLQPIASGQHEVEQNDVETLRCDTEERSFARVLDDRLVSFTLEPLAQSAGHFLFVFHDQDAHALPLQILFAPQPEHLLGRTVGIRGRFSGLLYQFRCES